MALLIILDHLLVLTICIHHLSHPLSLCGITYQTVLKPLLSSYLRLTYHISKYCYLRSLCPFFDMNFIIEKQFLRYHPLILVLITVASMYWGVICVKFNICHQTMPTCMHNMPSCKHNISSCMHKMANISMYLLYANLLCIHNYIFMQNIPT